ncbi:MAG: hypothetical protein O9325_18815, partial [Roseomonas sp.]|nr:hypothetical protein [Roseomonas sp.]
MAITQRLAETDLAQRRPERALDGTVLGYRSQILRHLRAQSLHRHADLFAEPVTVAEAIRWQTDLPGEKLPYAAHDAADQERLRQIVGTLITEVRSEAERLFAAGTDAQRRLAEVLDRATRGIEWDDLWVLTELAPEGGEPREHIVLAGWGLIAAEGRPPVPDLLGWSLAAPVAPERDPEPVPVPPAPPPVRGPEPSPWPLRLLALSALLLLMAGLLAWQLPALAGVLLGFRLPEPPACEAPPDSALLDLQREEARLRLRLAELERAYAGRVIQCRIARAPTPEPPAVPPTAVPAPQTPPAQRSELDQRLDRENAQRGRWQVTLAWDGPADLDLHVDCPGGERIFFGNQNACGGTHDIDMNAGGRNSDRPIENVVWNRPPPPGT